MDEAVKRLKELKVTSALIDAGGNIYCLGKKGGRKWRIGIQHPRQPDKIIFYLDLEDRAVSTSGDYQQFFSHQGRRFSHIINPKTGEPVDNGVLSATITAGTATEADALSTAVFVLGKEKAQALVKKTAFASAKIIEENDL
jgi:thiamine biosynthesis lipoprotein